MWIRTIILHVNEQRSFSQLPGGGPSVGVGSRLLAGFFGLVALALIVVVFVIALPVAIAAIVVVLLLGAAFFAWIRLRMWWRGLRNPNGALDGRKNVRVRGSQAHEVVEMPGSDSPRPGAG
jgi:hypothetical protein